MTADPPPPSSLWPYLTPPLWFVRMSCPHCGRLRRFETRYAQPGDNGRAWACQCGAVLGRVEVTASDNTRVRLLVTTGEPIDAPPQ